MKKVRPGLYIGNQFDAFYFLTGKHSGVTHILSVVPLCRGHEFSATLGPPRDTNVVYKIAAELENKCPDFSGPIVRKVIPVEDKEDENLLEHLEDALRFIDEGVTKGIVLVHCGGGISRSASVVTAYLMWKEKLSANEALASLKRCSGTVRPNNGFLKQLQTFQSSGFVAKKGHSKKQQQQNITKTYHVPGTGSFSATLLVESTNCNASSKHGKHQSHWQVRLLKALIKNAQNRVAVF